MLDCHAHGLALGPSVEKVIERSAGISIISTGSSERRLVRPSTRASLELAIGSVDISTRIAYLASQGIAQQLVSPIALFYCYALEARSAAVLHSTLNSSLADACSRATGRLL